MSNPDDFIHAASRNLIIAEMWLKQAGRTRDMREPGRLEKLQAEERIARIFGRVFRKQRNQVIAQLGERYPARKISDISAGLWLDDRWDDDDMADLVRELTRAIKGGVTLFADNLGMELDFALTNIEALRRAKDYAYDLVKGINATTTKLLRDTISAFVDTPGFRIKDVVELLEPAFGQSRALRIAVTEITRAYADGNAMAGKELQRLYPDIPVVEIWYTNNDEKVCEICAPFDGRKVGLDEPFAPGIDRPPAHPNCRCWTTTTTDIRAAR